MNKKGFTLAELLGVLVILAVIAAVVFMSISQALRKSRINTCYVQEKTLIEAAKNYFVDKKNDSEVTVALLISGGYLDSDFKSPMTNKSYNPATEVIKSGNSYSVNYKLHEEECPDSTVYITANSLVENVVSSGTGLYVDSQASASSSEEEPRYVYKGANPQDYIKFSDSLWRIVSVESDGTLKIMKKDSIGSMSWDNANNRNSTTSTYCKKPEWGCNVWAATTNFKMYYPNGNSKDTTVFSGSVANDASLNTYLNNTFYNTLNYEKKYIVNYNFGYGTSGGTSDTENFATNLKQEKSYIWSGKVGLISITDYLKGTSNTNCQTIESNYGGTAGASKCYSNNWLNNAGVRYWTITPSPDYSGNGTNVYDVWDGVHLSNANYVQGVHPAVYLRAGIKLTGEGTETDPFIIVK